MRRISLALLALILISSCKRNFEKFIFDASQVSEVVKHFYEYDAAKLKSKTEKTYIFFYGQLVDSLIVKTTYEYNQKGLLEITKSYYDQIPDIDLFEYDSQDSLVSKMTISPEGDTTFWEKYEYFPDGRKTIFHRYLTFHYEPGEDLTKAFENKTYDTTSYRNEYEYENKACKELKQFDEKNQLNKIIEYRYENNRLINEIHFSVFGTLKQIEMIKHFDYSKSDVRPDYYSLDYKKDTVEAHTYEFDKGNMAFEIFFEEYGNKYFKRYYENGKKIGEINSSIIMDQNIFDSYTYYENGDVKENKTYRKNKKVH